MRRAMIGILFSILMVVIVGCGTSSAENVPDKGDQEAVNDQVNGSKDAPQGIWEGELTTDLSQVLDQVGVFKFTIQNNKEEDVTLTFNSSQEYEYQILDEEGKVLFTYSMNKMFMQLVSEKELKPGESLEYEINVNEFLPEMGEGTYTLVVWSLADGMEEELKETTTFDYDGNYVPSPELPELTTETVEFIGLADNHSAEIKKANGDFEVYQLNDLVKEEFTKLAKGDSLTIDYIVNENGQKVIQSYQKN
ncbi:BsuPI-related putative proteinase inhibitor [Bacillaceae bacterium S4-13-56]